MEKLAFSFGAGQPARSRTVTGVVSSGDLEVLLEPGADGRNDDWTIRTDPIGP